MQLGLSTALIAGLGHTGAAGIWAPHKSWILLPILRAHTGDVSLSPSLLGSEVSFAFGRPGESLIPAQALLPALPLYDGNELANSWERISEKQNQNNSELIGKEAVLSWMDANSEN